MLSSKFVVHWSGQKDIELLANSAKSDAYAARLKDWYQNGLFAKRSDPELILRLQSEPGQVSKPKMKHLVRICFTEIRLSQAESHAQRYGKLGIGFHRDFIQNKGGRPVIYVPWEANARLMEASIWQAWEKSQGNEEVHRPLKWLLAFFKLMSNGQPEDSQNYEDYYEEMEWRLVYGESLDRSGTFTEGNEPNTFRVKFDPSDVMVIVFPNDNVRRQTLEDNEMQQFFSKHVPNLVLLEDCTHF